MPLFGLLSHGRDVITYFNIEKVVKNHRNARCFGDKKVIKPCPSISWEGTLVVWARGREQVIHSELKNEIFDTLQYYFSFR